jgi:hypothetical protein
MFIHDVIFVPTAPHPLQTQKKAKLATRDKVQHGTKGKGTEKKVKVKAERAFDKEHFATEKDYQPQVLEKGYDFVAERLRTACYKHKSNHRTSEKDRNHGCLGDSVHRDKLKPLPEGHFKACSCTFDSHIFDLLAWKVCVQSFDFLLYFSHHIQDPAQNANSQYLVPSYTAF